MAIDFPHEYAEFAGLQKVNEMIPGAGSMAVQGHLAAPLV